ncbi:hypothetical protein BJ508DRAFT_155553 [Ascobolus immersus RN42]|uniref:Uncharacterized protein n=1 Tax=Ascobolus immersus RN42 TaxID=1160509 RepID=A0A3N4HXI3_ASCIM|nr:hypothetical protein BJ508DRAFT_155553 [Ascobolus immersus RN42]
MRHLTAMATVVGLRLRLGDDIVAFDGNERWGCVGVVILLMGFGDVGRDHDRGDGMEDGGWRMGYCGLETRMG